MLNPAVPTASWIVRGNESGDLVSRVKSLDCSRTRGPWKSWWSWLVRGIRMQRWESWLVIGCDVSARENWRWTGLTTQMAKQMWWLHTVLGRADANTSHNHYLLLRSGEY